MGLLLAARAELAAKSRTAGRIYSRKWGWPLVILGVVWTLLAVWRDENPDGWQPPYLADVAEWLPWWAWGLIGLAVLVLVTFEGAHRYIKELVEPDLRFEWRGSSKWAIRNLNDWGETRTFVVSDLTLTNESNRKLILRLRVRTINKDGSSHVIYASHECEQTVIVRSPEGRLPHLPSDIQLGPGDHVRGHAEFTEVGGIAGRNVQELFRVTIEAEDIRTKRSWVIVWHREESLAEDDDAQAREILATLAERSEPANQLDPDKEH